MDRDSAIASWVDGDPDLLEHLPREEELLDEMLEQERIHAALAAFYDSGQVSGKVEASVMADILATSHEAARKTVWNTLGKTRSRKRLRERSRTLWFGALLAGAACALLVLANYQPHASGHGSPKVLVVAPTPAAMPETVTPEPTPETRIAESLPPPTPPPPALDVVPDPPALVIAAATPPSAPEPKAPPEEVDSLPAPLIAMADIQPPAGRDPNLRPFSERSQWNLPLPANTKLTGPKLAARERNPRIFLRHQPVFFSKIQMPERELWVGESKVGLLRMPAGVNLQMFRESPLILIAPDGLIAWEVIRPRPSGEGRIGADRATRVDLARDNPDTPPLIAGIIRAGELENGIPHALSIGLPASLIKSKFPLGSRIAIPKNQDPEKFGAAREVARALRDYGGIVTFISQSDTIEILSASGANPGIQSSLQEISGHLRKAAEGGDQ